MDDIEMALAIAMGDATAPPKARAEDDLLAGLDLDGPKPTAKTGIVEQDLDAQHLSTAPAVGRGDLRSALLVAITDAVERVLKEAGVPLGS